MSYLDTLKKLGLGVERLNAEEPVVTTIQVKSLAEFKELFAGSLSHTAEPKH